MLVLPEAAGRAVPADSEELERAIHESLDQMFRLPERRRVVQVRPASDAAYPAVASIHVDLSGAEVELENLPEPPKPSGRAKPGPAVAQFEVIGHPILYHGAELDLTLSARDVEFEFKSDQDGRPLLMMKRAQTGHVEVRITRDDLNELLLEAAREAAAPHGVTITDVRADLSQDDPRAPELSAAVRVTARKLLTAVIVARGRIVVDDAFNAVTSDLACEGQGMLGSLVCGLLKPHIQKLNNRKFSIAALPLGDVRLHDVDVKLDPRELRMAAEFGA